MSDMQTQSRLGFPAYRVFIFGVEVTEDVLSINTNMHDGGAPNQCSITLNNELDKYIITTRDLMLLMGTKEIKLPWMSGASYGAESIEYSRPVNRGLSVDATAEELAALGTSISLIDQARKRDILSRKLSVIEQTADLRVDHNNRPISETNYTDYFGAPVRRYPLSDGASIFHPMDPVRVVERDPFDPSRWYWAFSGYVSDMADAGDENNNKTLTIVAEDPTKLFRYTRLAVNPGIVDARSMITEQDLKVQSFHSSFMYDFTLPEVFYTLLFGPHRVKAKEFIERVSGPNGELPTSTRLRGIGHFSFDNSTICTFGPPLTEDIISTNVTPPRTGLNSEKQTMHLGDDLRYWQTLIDHEVQPSDIWMMASDHVRKNAPLELPSTDNLQKGLDGTVLIDAVIQEICTRPECYPVDGGRLMMLIPRSLGVDNNSILIKDIINAYPLSTEFTTTGQILMEVIERIQFSMYCTPRGDIVIEPPLFDFDPDDFGMKPMTSDEIIEHSASVGYTALVTAESRYPGRSRGPFGPKYIIGKRDTHSWEKAQVDEGVFTFAVARHAIFQNWEELPYSDIVGDLTVVSLSDLVPLYGVRELPLTPRGYIATREGARLYANISLNKANADSHNLRVSHIFNIQMWVNRPIYIQTRNCLGTTKNITHSITWGQQGSVETTSEIYAIRSWAGQVSDDGRALFEPIGGYASRPLNYAILMRRRDPPTSSESNVGLTTLLPQARNRIDR